MMMLAGDFDGKSSASNEMPPNHLEPVTMGTTLAVMKCKDGVIAASDSRTSHGSLISNEFTDKIQQISDTIVSLQAGLASSSQFLVNYAKTEALLYKRLHQKNIPIIALVTKVSKYLYKYPQVFRSALIFAGHDNLNGFQAYFLIGGVFQEMNTCTLGSGSIYITEMLAEFYNSENTVEKTLPFMTKSILHAINSDTRSGGVANVKVVTKDGIIRCANADASSRLDQCQASASALCE